MAAVVVLHEDPGPSIQWARTPAYSSSLIAAVSLLNRTEAHHLFQTDGSLGRNAKAAKKTNLMTVTTAIFKVDEGGDRTKQVASVGRRLIAMGKDYSNDIEGLKLYRPTVVATKLAALRQRLPWWDSLRTILQGHPNFENWDPAFDYPAEREANRAALGIFADEDDGSGGWPSDDDDAMEGVEYQHNNPHSSPQPNPHNANAVAGPVPAHYHNPPPQLFPNSPGAERCPKCDIALTPATSVDHLRACFDGDGGAVAECPICQTVFEATLGSKDREKHVERCCESGGRNEVDGAAVFVCDVITLPKDEFGTVKECAVCLDDFELRQRLTRLSCLCVFHEKCMEEWWATKKGFCPSHVKVKPGERP